LTFRNFDVRIIRIRDLFPSINNTINLICFVSRFFPCHVRVDYIIKIDLKMSTFGFMAVLFRFNIINAMNNLEKQGKVGQRFSLESL
jgi:hypothetical protein